MFSSYDYSTKYEINENYGIEGPNRKNTDDPDPEEELQLYLKSPEPLSLRENLGSAVLVSGWVETKARSDQEVFDFLNDEESAFGWEKIVAFVKDEKFAKKRLFSRSARYTGLSDKLEFRQGEKLPSVEQLQGIGSWVANVGSDLSLIKEIADLCSKSDVKNVSILINGSVNLDMTECREAVKILDDSSNNCQYTVVAVGEIEEHAEGSQPYEVNDFGTEEGIVSGSYSRVESLRLVTDCLQMDSGCNKALTFREAGTNSTAAKLVKGLREGGFSRPQEIDHIITKGVSAYDEAIKDYKQRKWEKENPDPEVVAKEMEEREKQAKLDWEKSEKEFEQRKIDEIEGFSKEWAKREYFRKSMGGNMGMTEEEFIKSEWKRAMFEGDLKYRMMHGQKTDERKELAEFLGKQDKKKGAALKKARKLLEEQLGTKLPEDLDNDDDDDEDED